MNLLQAIITALGGGTGTSSPSTPYAAPTSFITDDINSRFSWTDNAGVAATGYEYRLSGGSPVACTSNPQFIPRGAHATGAVEVRVKANGSHSASSWLANTVAFTATPGSNTGKANVVAFGDSLANMWGPALGALVDTSKYSGVIVSSRAGWLSTELINVYQDDAFAYYDPTSSRNIFVINQGTNNFNGGSSTAAADVKANYVSMVQWLKARGWLVVVVLCSDTGADTSSPHNSQHPQHSVWAADVRATWNTDIGADAFADVAADPNIGKLWAGNPYSTDGTHLTTSGATNGSAVNAGIVLAQTDALEARLSILPSTLSVTSNNTTKEFGVTIPSGYSIGDIEYTLDKGRTWATLPTNPLVVPYGRLTGFVGARVKKLGDNAASVPAFNLIDFTNTTNGPAAEYAYCHGDTRWNMGGWNGAASTIWYYIGSTGNRAGIHFTKGIKVESNVDEGPGRFPFAGATIEIFVDNVSQGQVTVTGYGQTLFDYQPGTTSTKLLEIEWVSGNYFILQGATLTN